MRRYFHGANLPLNLLIPYLNLDIDWCNCCKVHSMQAASSTSQPILAANVPELVVIDVVNSVSGDITLVDSRAIVPEAGVYSITASGETGSSAPATGQTFRLWLQNNCIDIADSNVLMDLVGVTNDDALDTQVLVNLAKYDAITVMMAASSSSLGIGLRAAAATATEPAVPGIKLSIHRVR